MMRLPGTVLRSAMLASTTLVLGPSLQMAGATVIFSNPLTANNTGLSSGQSAAASSWASPTAGTPYYQNTIAGATGATTYSWATNRVTNASDLTAMATEGFSVSVDFTITSPSRTTSATAPSNNVGIGALGNTNSFNRFSGSIAYYYAQLSTVGVASSTPGAMTIGAQNLAGQGSSGGTIASGVSFVGSYASGSSGTGLDWTALSGTYHMVLKGTYDASNNLTLSFTVSNLDGSNAATLTTAPIAGTVLPSSTNSYFGLKDTAANGGGVDRFNNFVIQTVPEPASLALFGLGTLLMVKRRRHA